MAEQSSLNGASVVLANLDKLLPDLEPLYKFGQHDESLHLIGALDDLHLHVGQDLFDRLAELGSLVAAIGIELQQEGIEAEQCREQPSPAVAVLDVGRSDDGVQHQPLSIDQHVPLLAFDLLAGVVAVRVDVSTALFCAFDALGVDDRRGWAGFA